jgi:MFS family permease
METVAVGVYVTQTTGQSGWTGTIAALAYVPTVVLGPVGGALADRFDRRRYLAAVALFQTLLAGLLALLAAGGHLSIPLVALIVLLEGAAIAAYLPAVQAMTPDLVDADDLLGAMSLGAAQFNLGRVVGPALAALVIAGWGLAWAFWLNTVSFGAVLAALALITVPPLRRRGEHVGHVWRTVAEGVGSARRDTGIRIALLLLTATTFLVSPFIGLVPAVAIKVFGEGASGTSALVTAQGVGAVCAALAAGPLAARLGRGRLLVVALLLVGPLAAAYGLAPTFPLAVAGIAVLGFCYLNVLSGVGTVCQRATGAAGPHRQPVHAGRGRGAFARAGRPGLAGRPGRPATGHRGLGAGPAGDRHRHAPAPPCAAGLHGRARRGCGRRAPRH